MMWVNSNSSSYFKDQAQSSLSNSFLVWVLLSFIICASVCEQTLFVTLLNPIKHQQDASFFYKIVQLHQYIVVLIVLKKEGHFLSWTLHLLTWKWNKMTHFITMWTKTQPMDAKCFSFLFFKKTACSAICLSNDHKITPPSTGLACVLLRFRDF